MTNRWIAAHVLRHTRRLTDGIVKVVPEDARRLRLLTILARPAREHEFVSHLVFFRVQHVGTVGHHHVRTWRGKK